MSKRLFVLKFTLAVETEVVKLKNGKNVWRASHPSTDYFADGETPEQAVENFKSGMQRVESAKFKKESQVEKESKEEAKKADKAESEEEEQEPKGEDKVSDEDEAPEGAKRSEREGAGSKSLSLEEMSYKDLQALAFEKGIKSVGVKKEDLINLIKESE